MRATGGANYNEPAGSGIDAADNAPWWSEHLGWGHYVVRVQACVDGLIDSEEVARVDGYTKEKCKKYPSGNWKPIGLLQEYGDDEQLLFGMVAGSYNNHTRGGNLVRNIGSLAGAMVKVKTTAGDGSVTETEELRGREVNVDTDGTFPQVASFASTRSDAPATGSGLINAWSLYRVVGWDYVGVDGGVGYWGTVNADNCKWLITDAEARADGRCRNWGNPYAEIYAQSLSYLAGQGLIADYSSNDAGVIPGLPASETAVDPLKGQNYDCVPISMININSSVVSYDADNLDKLDVSKIWHKDVITKPIVTMPGAPATGGGTKTVVDMTNEVGEKAGLHNKAFFFGQKEVGGEIDLGDLTGNNGMCDAKMLTALGEIGGLCPEAPKLEGSYRIAGLAHYANQFDIRQDLPGDQKLNNYAVALAAGTPKVEVPDPEGGVSGVTIMPACTMVNGNIQGRCAIVDFKIASQEIDKAAKTVKGTLYVNWEDSEQGGDFDQDMWGVLKYTYHKGAKTFKVESQVFAQSANPPMAFGYVLSGTENDGFHAHSGINNYIGTNECRNAGGCSVKAGFTSKTHKVGSSVARSLEDPLFYASKWGGGEYFYAKDPSKLEESLANVFAGILVNAASGTAAALVPTNVRGEGAVYQAGYDPDGASMGGVGKWSGSLQSLWMDSAGLTREDCGGKSDGTSYSTVEIAESFTRDGKCRLPDGFVCLPNGRLDNYCVDRVVEFKSNGSKTMAHVKNSDVPNSFKSASMRGVVTGDPQRVGDGWNVPLSPFIMEGQVSSAVHDGEKTTLMLTPYRMTATADAFNESNGDLRLKITDGKCPQGREINEWVVTANGMGSGLLSDLKCSSGDQTAVISAAGELLDALKDMAATSGAKLELTLQSSNMTGPEGQSLNVWQAVCLAGGSGAPAKSESSVRLSNAGSAQELTVAGDFGSCKHLRLVSYDVSVDPQTKEKWEVHNLDNLVTGDSNSPIHLANDDRTWSINVTSDNVDSPLSAWISDGDTLLLTHQNVSIVEKNGINPIWSAEKQLRLDDLKPDALKTNRTYTDSAGSGRYIMTWIDDGAGDETAAFNGKVDPGEFRALEENLAVDSSGAPIANGPWRFLDVNDANTARNVINWTRGVEVAGLRGRADVDGNVHRLGDIIDSSPTVVSAPMENYDFLYKDYMNDYSYRKFRTKYLDRRAVIYAGANDGMLHAFNGGFYHCLDGNLQKCVSGSDPKYISYNTNNRKGDVTEHPLGAELWAYAPSAALPHLRWLASPSYGAAHHVYYVNGVPRAFDADIFEADTTHIGGWGTILVVGMDRGGPEIELSNVVDADKKAYKTHSAYLVFDITDPEQPPVLLGEIPTPDGSFTTVYPAAASFGKGDAKRRDWYLVFGNGPKKISRGANQATTDENAAVYLFDLGQLVNRGGGDDTLPRVMHDDAPEDCERKSLLGGDSDDSSHEILICKSDQEESFIGAPTVVDWDMNFTSNAAYIGVVGGKELETEVETDDGVQTVTSDGGPGGAVLKMDFANQSTRGQWTLHTFYETERPVTAQPMVGLDNLNNCWIYFGTGRLLSVSDRRSYYDNYLYGIKDGRIANGDCKSKVGDYGEQVLVDVSYTDVFTDGELAKSSDMKTEPGPYFTVGNDWTSASGLMLTDDDDRQYGDVESDSTLAKMTRFDELLEYIDEDKAYGWRRYLPYILSGCKSTQDDECYAPSTRSLTRPTLAGGVVFYTVYEPDIDPCEGQGKGRLYGLNYKTGTANPDPILGVRMVTRYETVNGQSVAQGTKILSMAYYEPSALGQLSAPNVKMNADGSTTVEFQGGDQSRESVNANLELDVKPGRISWEEKVDE